MISRLAASANAIPLFSTASHPPYELVNGSEDVDWCSAGLNDAGSAICAVKITLEGGWGKPRITCCIVAYTRGCDAAAPRPARVCANAASRYTGARTSNPIMKARRTPQRTMGTSLCGPLYVRVDHQSTHE